uniref:Uncharacterized protein n=1 Tax=Anguilla anguilla TaxID=7936 RepID=A0A0E9XDA2_ANGAN
MPFSEMSTPTTEWPMSASHFMSTAFPQRGKKTRIPFLPHRILSMLLSSILCT